MPRDNFFRVPWLDNVVDAVVSAAGDIGNNLNPNQRNRNRQPGGHTNNATTTATFTNNVPSDNQRAPPASARAIRQLATIRVAPEDLVEQCNRECCICLEE